MEITKALTFRASSIGDCLMAKYFLDTIHVQYPGARLGIVVASRVGMIRDLLADYPYIEVIEANRRSPAGLLRLWREWRGSELVVTQYAGKRDGSFSLPSKCMARLVARRGGLVGFTDTSPLNTLLYDHLLDGPDLHSPAENERRALRAAGLGVPLPYPSLTKPRGRGALEKFGLREGQYVLLNLFSGSIKRGLNPDKRRNLVTALHSSLPDTEILLTGAVADTKDAVVAAGFEARAIAGEATLQEVTELVAHARAVVSLDTGVGHIAAQLRQPVCILSTCMGLWWWNEEQYGKDASYHVFTAPLHSIAEHLLEDYPACLNEVDLESIARVASSAPKGIIDKSF